MSKIFRNVFMSDLVKVYSFEDEPTVVKFLFENTYLVDILFDAEEHLKKYFPAANYRVSLYKTGIIQDQIMIRIYNDKDPDENDAMLERFDNDWWIENMPRTKGKLGITA